MTDPDARRLLWFLFAGSRGGTGRIILDYSKSVNIVTGGEGTLYLSEDEQALSAKGADVASDGSPQQTASGCTTWSRTTMADTGW